MLGIFTLVGKDCGNLAIGLGNSSVLDLVTLSNKLKANDEKLMRRRETTQKMVRQIWNIIDNIVKEDEHICNFPNLPTVSYKPSLIKHKKCISYSGILILQGSSEADVLQILADGALP